jgi:hypothetical protein
VDPSLAELARQAESFFPDEAARLRDAIAARRPPAELARLAQAIVDRSRELHTSLSEDKSLW